MALKICPITDGHKTIMTESTFWALCSSRREKGFKYDFCHECLGKKPNEVEFKDVKREIEKEKAMKKQCSFCGREANLKKYDVYEACHNCCINLAAAKNNPELLIQMISLYHPDLITGGGPKTMDDIIGSQPEDEIEKLLALAKKEEISTKSAGGVALYLSIIKVLRDEKNFTFADIAEWLKKHDIPTSKSAICNAYRRDQEKNIKTLDRGNRR